MGEAIYRREPVARAVLDRCDELIREGRDVSLLDVMFGRAGTEQDLADPEWLQPAIYALDCALTAQWTSLGIRPTAVVGHGLEGLVAAQAAGVFSLETGLQLATALGALKKTQPEQDRLTMLEAMKTSLADLTVATPSVSLISNVTGHVMEAVDMLDIDYWLRQDQEITEFSGCAKTLAQLGVNVVAEVGPDSTLDQTIGDAWPESVETPTLISTLISTAGDGESPKSDDGFVRAVAGAYEAGLDISFPGLFAGEVRRRISLPSYPFQRRRHWV